jgi:radical SAM protein with 4Fe4S-binding SPASM domain
MNNKVEKSMGSKGNFVFLNIINCDMQPIIQLLNEAQSNGMRGVIPELLTAIETGQFKLNNAEIHFINNNPDKIIEYLVFRYKFRFFPRQQRMEKFPVHLLIEPASICNIKCIMCWQSNPDFRRKKELLGTMCVEMFKKIIDEAVEHNCKAITFAGRGEPLCNKNIAQFFRYTAGKFFDFKVNTNALLMNKQVSKDILESSVTQLIFSIDAFTADEYEKIRVGGKFQRLLENINYFNSIRKNYPSSKIETRVSGVKINNSFDEYGFLKFWSKYVDNVVYVEMEERNSTYNNLLQGNHKVCDRLFERLYIWWDGKCSPCDIDYETKLNIGDFTRNSLEEIWIHGYNILRQKHKDGVFPNPCDKCDYNLITRE